MTTGAPSTGGLQPPTNTGRFSKPGAIDFTTIARATINQWRTIGATQLIFLLLITIYVIFIPRTYSADQQIVVTGQVVNPLQISLSGSSLGPSELVAAQIAIMQSESLQARVSQKLGRDVPQLGASAQNQSTVVLMSVTDSSPPAATEALQSYLDEYLAVLQEESDARLNATQVELIRELTGYNRQLASSPQGSPEATTIAAQIERTQASLDQVRSARASGPLIVNPIGGLYVNPETVRPRPVRDFVLAALCGLAVGLMLAVVQNSRPSTQSSRAFRESLQQRAPRQSSQPSNALADAREDEPNTDTISGANLGQVGESRWPSPTRRPR